MSNSIVGIVSFLFTITLEEEFRKIKQGKKNKFCGILLLHMYKAYLNEVFKNNMRTY